MAIHDTEEEQIAAIKKWWQANGTSVIVGAVAGISIIGGWNYWQTYQQDQAIQTSSLFETLLVNVDEKKSEEAEKINTQIVNQNATSVYATLSRLFIAKTKVQQGDLAAAKNILESLMHEAYSAELRNIARIRLVKILQALGENEQGLQLIAETNPADIDAFAASYDELSGDIYVALDRLDAARTAYKSAVSSGEASPLLALKMNDITSVKIIEDKPTNSLIKK